MNCFVQLQFLYQDSNFIDSGIRSDIYSDRKCDTRILWAFIVVAGKSGMHNIRGEDVIAGND